jgi:uncharacterized protein YfaS (alpha-2-macroglobulin family)
MSYKKKCVGLVILLFVLLLPVISRGEFFNLWNRLKKAKVSSQEFEHIEPGILPAFSLKVLSVTPKGITKEAHQTKSIVVTFEEPMVALKVIPEGDSSGPLSFEPPIKGKYRWQGTTTLVFTPEEPLPKATFFKATIPEGIKSLQGKELKKDYVWSFETIRPQLLWSDPHHSSQFIGLKQGMTLHFNQKMSLQKAREFIEIRGKKTENLFDRIKTYQENDYPERTNFAIRYLKGKELERWKYYLKDNAIETFLILFPKGKYEQEYTYTIVLKKGLSANEGNLGLLKQREIQFKTYNHFRLLSSSEKFHPLKSLILRFSNPVSLKDIYQNITFNPPITLPEKPSTYHSISGYISLNFKPSTAYKFQLSGELQDQFGNKLGKEIEKEFFVSSYQPRIRMSTGKGILESTLDKQIPVDIININSIDKKMVIIPHEQVIPLMFNDNELFFSHKAYDFKNLNFVSENWKVKLPHNKRIIKPINLKESLKGEKNGFVFIQLNIANAHDLVEDFVSVFHQKYYKSFIQVTNLGLTAKFSPEDTFVYVSSLESARPVKKARIEIRDKQNKILWEGKTGKDGSIQAPGWATFKMSRPNYYTNPELFVIAYKDDDAAIISNKWGTGIYPYSFGIPYQWYPVYPEYAAHIYTDRGIYRSGDTIHIKGVFRKKKQGQWIISNLKEVEMVINNSRDENIFKGLLPVNNYGSFTYDLKLKSSAPTGNYSIKVSPPSKEKPKSGVAREKNKLKVSYQNQLKASGSFRVEAYRPAKFEVLVKGDKESYIVDDTFQGIISAAYNTSSFSPQGHKGYYFKPFDWYVFFAGKRRNSSVIIASGKDKLSKDGLLEVTAKIKSKAIFGTGNLVLEANVTDVDRQRISGRKGFIVHPGLFYLGLKPSTTFVEEGKDVQINVLAVDLEGNKVANKKVNLELYREEWHSVRKAGVGGKTEWVTERKDIKQDSFSVNTSDKPVEVKMKPGKPGYYYIKAESMDKRKNKIYSSTYLYVFGKGYVPWRRTDDDSIELIADKTKYMPGETARIMVKSPYEKTSALVTLEREGIITHFTQQLKGSADTIKIPIKSEYLPNVFVSVVLIQGRIAKNKFNEKGFDIGKPSFKMGYINLPVDSGDKHLKVLLETDKKEYRPGNEVAVTLRIKDAKGKSRSAELSIAVVDRGVIDLIAYKTPNSFPYFYGSRALSIMTAESRQHLIGQRNYGQKGENRGGGGGEGLKGLEAGIDLRKDFKATAFWTASLTTDKKGKAKVNFKLPENLTTFRLMVSAHTKDSLFGAGEKDFKVRKPLMLKGSLPRFVRRDDIFQAGVVVHNGTGKAGQVMIEAQTQGITLLGERKKIIQIKKNEAKEVLFDFRADKIGEINFQFASRMGEETDGINLKIPVHLSRVAEVVALFNQTKTKMEEAIIIPRKIYPELGGIELTGGSTAFVGLKEGIRYLLGYPYECLEQKISRIFPFLIAGDLLDTFNISDITAKEKIKFINDLIAEIPEYQTYSGGFTAWPDSQHPSPYLSCYVMFFLAEAQNKGYQINDKVISKGISYLKSVLRSNGEIWNYPYNFNARLCTKAFAAYSLARWKTFDQGSINKLYEECFRIPIFGRAMLLKAVHLAKMGQSLEDKIIQTMINQIKEEPSRAHFEEDGTGLGWIYYSNVRTTAYILQSMLEVKNEFAQAPKIIRWLMDERKNGRWRNTQENLYVFYALTEYFKKYEKEEPNFTAQIKFAHREVFKELFQGRQTDIKAKMIPWKETEAGKKLPVKILKTGIGRFYYGIRMHYALKEPVLSRNEGFLVHRRYETLKGKEVSDLFFEAGETFKVVIEVTTPQDRNFVVVEDQLPAGFEPLNQTFATAGQEEMREINKNKPGYYQWWGSFNHQEIYDDKVVLFADYMTRGKHTRSYLIRSITRGDFIVPPCKAEGMYTPEIFGYSKELKIKVK